MNTLKYLDICTMDGELLVTLLVKVRDDGNGSQVTSPREPSNGRGKENVPEKLTEAQQRKLFRLLAEKGIHGDPAHDELKRRFRVTDLGDVSKLEASKMIERLIEEVRGGR